MMMIVREHGEQGCWKPGAQRTAGMHRARVRGFTLLEMMLAVMLSGMLVVVVVGMFMMVERTDRALTVRHQQAADMAMLHLAMNRAFSSMLMATETQAAAESQNRAGILGGERLRVSRPRLLLEEDVAAARGGNVVQRLEVVVSKAPVPPGFGREWAVMEVEHSMSGPIRGVFELRPEGKEFAMWWRPLPRDEMEEDGYRFNLDPREDDFAVRLAGSITEAKWLAFKNREREPMLTAMMSHDLPAHMELHVRMSSGYAAQWMFEVQWINGPETAEELAQELEEAEMLGGLGVEGGTPGGATGGVGTGSGATSPGAGMAAPGATPVQRGTGGRNMARPAPGADRAP